MPSISNSLATAFNHQPSNHFNQPQNLQRGNDLIERSTITNVYPNVYNQNGAQFPSFSQPLLQDPSMQFNPYIQNSMQMPQVCSLLYMHELFIDFIL